MERIVMEVLKKGNSIIVVVNGIEYTIIDENGQIQLKQMHRFIIDCSEKNVTQDAEIVFDENIEEDLQNGISLFLRDILSKTISEDMK